MSAEELVEQVVDAVRPHVASCLMQWLREERRWEALEERVDTLELSGRRLNVVFTGLPEGPEPHEALKAVEQVVAKGLGLLEMDVRRCVRRAYRVGEGLTRPIVAHFRHFRDRQRVLQAASRLPVQDLGFTVYGYAPTHRKRNMEEQTASGMSSGGTTEESLKLWLKVGNLKKLEQAVLDGHGDLLRGRTSRIPKINKFLKRVPHYQAKVASLHAASASGSVRELETLLDRKGLVLARGPDGESLLETAVLKGQEGVVKYLLDKYPMLLVARDHGGRSPLHYAALANDDGHMYQLISGLGVDKDIKDLKGKTALDYKENPGEHLVRLQGSDDRKHVRPAQDTLALLLRQPSPIAPMTKTEVRNLIAKGDVAKLERTILHGYGDRLTGETASSGRIRALIDSVPVHQAKLAAIKSAVESGSLREVKNLLNRKCLVLARDSQGLTLLHHAVIGGQKDIVDYLVQLSPRAVFAKDHDKRTPVHYAAALTDDGIYKALSEAGGNTTLPDCDGKTPEFYRLNPTALTDPRGSEGSAKKNGSVISIGSNSNKISGSNKSENLNRSSSTRKHSTSSGSGSSSSVVKLWLRSGDMEKLEKAVVDGHGLKLIRETTSDPRARAFLRTVPQYMSKIAAVHEAVCQGSLRALKVVMDRKKLILSRDQLGLGLLHKAVLYEHGDIAHFLLNNYPETLNIKDKSGRTALHYAAAISGSDQMYQQLVENGADPQQQDTKGKSAEFYLTNKEQLDVKEIVNRVNRKRNRHQQSVANSKQMTTSVHSNGTTSADAPSAAPGLVINGGNIRKWIHAEDLAKLEQVVLEGQGYKLLLETSNNPRVKHFLVGVPALVNKLKEVHGAAVSNDVATLELALDKAAYVKSKDEAGMTPLHKAVLLENDGVIAFILANHPEALYARDEEGRTPLHYAAGLKDGARVYAQLSDKCPNPTLDNRGKAPEHYLRHVSELDMRQLLAHAQRSRSSNKTDTNNNHNNSRRPGGPNNLRPVRKASGGGVSNESISKAIQAVELDKLEQLVLDGYGKRLLGKSSWSEEVRAFLKKVPQYMDKIYALHSAAATGDLLTLQRLMDKKAMATCRDEYGLTALHKAVKYGQADVAKYLLQAFPGIHNTKDQDGRTPLHYAAIYKGREDIYRILINSGADSKIQDHRGKSAEHYLLSSAKLEAPTIPRAVSEVKISTEMVDDAGNSNDEAEDKSEDESEWISSGNIEELERVVLSGRGERLLGRSSEHPASQEFLEAVPVYMGRIRAVHNAAASGDVKDLQGVLSEQPKVALSSDEHGACPLHRAVLHGHKDAMRFLANNHPQCLNLTDKSGLTPLHYAAMVNDDGYFYRLLHNCGADPNLKDKSGLTPGQMLRGGRVIKQDELVKRYEERKVPPRPHSVQTWERPPTEELLRALTPSPMAAAALENDKDATIEIRKGEVNVFKKDEEGEDTEDSIERDQRLTEVNETESELDKDDEVKGEEEDEKYEKEKGEKDEEESAKDEEEDVKSEKMEEKDEILNDETSSDNVEDDLKISDLENRLENENQDEKEAEETAKDELENVKAESELFEKEDDEAELEKVDDKPEFEKEEDRDMLQLRNELETEKEELESDTEAVQEIEDEPDKNLFGNIENVSENVLEKSEDIAENSKNLIEDAKDEIEKIGNNLEDARNEIEKAKNEVENAANDRVEEARDKLEEVENNIEELEDNIGEVENNIEEAGNNLENAGNNLENAGDNIKNALDNLEDDGNLLTDDLNKSEKDFENLKKNLKDANIDFKNVETYLKEADTTNESEEDEGKSTNDEAEEEVNRDEDENDGESSFKEKDEDDLLELKNDEADSKEEEEPMEKLDEPMEAGEEPRMELIRAVNEEDGSVGLEKPETQALLEAESKVRGQLESQGSVESDSDVVMMSKEAVELKEGESFLSLNSPWSVENDYLTAALGDALIVAMAEVSRVRPEDPITYLALLLYRYLHRNSVDSKNLTNKRLVDGPLSPKELSEVKTSDGNTLVHFAMSKRAHQPWSMDGLLVGSGFNVGLRDGGGRTTRDVAMQVGEEESVAAVDRHVLRLVRAGQLGQVENLIYDGYDHLLDILDEEGNDVIMVAELTHQLQMVHVLKNVDVTQRTVEEFFSAVSQDQVEAARALLETDPRLATAQNSNGQTALHLAILNESERMSRLLASYGPKATSSADNMKRTPVHYAMGTTDSALFTKILLNAGGSTTSRDVLNRRPCFYFMDRSAIQHLQLQFQQQRNRTNSEQNIN